jgi:PP-loop superfamily ATP-utilizing enzyme
MSRAIEPAVAEQLTRELRALGYQHVTIDLQGYRLGSLNEALRLRPVQ